MQRCSSLVCDIIMKSKKETFQTHFDFKVSFEVKEKRFLNKKCKVRNLLIYIQFPTFKTVT